MKKHSFEHLCKLIVGMGLLGATLYLPVTLLLLESVPSFVDCVATTSAFAAIGASAWLLSLLSDTFGLDPGLPGFGITKSLATIASLPKSKVTRKETKMVNGRAMSFEYVVGGLQLGNRSSNGASGSCSVLDRMLVTGNGAKSPGYVKAQVTAKDILRFLRKARTCDYGKNLSERTQARAIGSVKYWVIRNLITEIEQETGYQIIVINNNRWRELAHPWGFCFGLVISYKFKDLGVVIDY
jgi:hypothetical protein